MWDAWKRVLLDVARLVEQGATGTRGRGPRLLVARPNSCATPHRMTNRKTHPHSTIRRPDGRCLDGHELCRGHPSFSVRNLSSRREHRSRVRCRTCTKTGHRKTSSPFLATQRERCWEDMTRFHTIGNEQALHAGYTNVQNAATSPAGASGSGTRSAAAIDGRDEGFRGDLGDALQAVRDVPGVHRGPEGEAERVPARSAARRTAEERVALPRRRRVHVADGPRRRRPRVVGGGVGVGGSPDFAARLGRQWLARSPQLATPRFAPKQA